MRLPVYVINLERSAARRKRISNALDAAEISFQIVAAIDGGNPGDESTHATYDEDAGRRCYLAPLSAGEIACMHSHRKAWEIFLRTSEAPAAVFLEDDAEPLADDAELQAFAETLATLDVPMLCKLNLPGDIRPSHRTRRTRRCLIAPLTNASQILNRAAARTLLDFTSTFYEPADVALQRWWDHRVRILVARPPLFREVRERDYCSTIRPQGVRPAEGRLLREIRRPIFQAGRLARAWMAKILQGKP